MQWLKRYDNKHFTEKDADFTADLHDGHVWRFAD